MTCCCTVWFPMNAENWHHVATIFILFRLHIKCFSRVCDINHLCVIMWDPNPIHSKCTTFALSYASPLLITHNYRPNPLPMTPFFCHILRWFASKTTGLSIDTSLSMARLHCKWQWEGGKQNPSDRNECIEHFIKKNKQFIGECHRRCQSRPFRTRPPPPPHGLCHPEKPSTRRAERPPTRTGMLLHSHLHAIPSSAVLSSWYTPSQPPFSSPAPIAPMGGGVVPASPGEFLRGFGHKLILY